MLKNVIRYGLSEGVAKLAPFLTSFYLATKFSPEHFGEYALLLVYFEIFYIIIANNIQAVTRVDYFKLSSEYFNKKVRLHLFNSIFTILLTFFFVLIVTNYSVIMLIAASFAVLLRVFSSFSLTVLQCQKLAKKYAAVNLSYIIPLSLGTVVLFSFTDDVLLWVYVLLLSSIIQYTISCKYVSSPLFKVDVSNDSTITNATVLIAGAMFMPQAVGWWLRTGAERVLVEDKLSSTILGNYALSAQLASILVVTVGVINLAVVPHINEKMKASAIQDVKFITRKVSFFILSVSFLLMPLAYFLIYCFYSEKYEFASDYVVYSIICLIPQSLMMVYVNILYFSNKALFVAITILIGYTLYAVVLNFYLVDYGMMFLFSLQFLVNIIMLLAVLYKVNLVLNTEEWVD
ncbi:oligosaccharide flippase family protein [Vibrio sp. 10N.222.51.C5]|uniref:oligosaccharide flippase family protein n=1 Tax=Vibrio sp. 10N.222.51.C5 TaxID=3229623 RepID=UPI00354D8DCD